MIRVLIAPAFACLFNVAAVSAVAQSPPAIDAQGNLVSMPFEPDFPVARSTVERQGESLAFVFTTPMPYEDALDHFHSYYYARSEIAPGWRIIGSGFDVGQSCYFFTLRYASQMYRIEVRPDEVSGGSIVSFVGRGQPLTYRQTLPTAAPYRALDVGEVELEL